MMKRYFACIFFFAFLAGSSQTISKSLRLARKAVDKGDFATGATEYKKALALDSNHVNANLEYGLLLFEYMNEPAGAGRYLVKAEKSSSKDTFPELLFGLGKYYHFIHDPEKALYYYKRFYRYIDLKDKDGVLLEQEVSRYITNCEYTIASATLPTHKRIQVINSGKDINTMYPEYVPVLSSDKKTLMFTSRRRLADNSKIDDEFGGFFEDMYMAQRDANGSFKDPKPFSLQGPKKPGTMHKHESAISLSFVGDRFFTFYDGKIYESIKQGDSWSNPAVLNENLNQANEFRNHVCISPDGQTLYYSAERSDGLGGLDLYKCEKGSDGKWNAGTNLGPSINTREDEGGPLLSESGNVLYFSSKGLPGYGGYDIFKASINKGEWGKPMNMGEPFNGAGDDIYLTINEKETEGFLSSSRPGGFGDMDIYEIIVEKPFTIFTLDPMAGVKISLPDTVYLGDTVVLCVETAKPDSAYSNFYWQVNEQVLNDKGNRTPYVFDQLGNYRIRVQGELNNPDMALLGSEKNIVVASKPVITVASNTVSTTTSPTVDVSSLESIYFDLNNSGIDAAAAKILDRNLEALNKSESVQIEILAYSDVRGSEPYNLALSQKRARAVYNYLKKKGFKAKRVKRVKGLGEKDLVNRCSEGVTCSEEEHRMNRRVILQVLRSNK